MQNVPPTELSSGEEAAVMEEVTGGGVVVGNETGVIADGIASDSGWRIEDRGGGFAANGVESDSIQSDGGGSAAVAVEGVPGKPASGDAAGIAPVGTEEAAAVADPGNVDAVTSASSIPGPDASPSADETQTALVMPKPPQLEDQSGRIRDFFKSRGTGTCFLALPTSVRSAAVEADVYSEAPDQFTKFADAFAGAVDAGLSLNRTLISQTQCSALDVVKTFLGGETQTLTLVLPSSEVADGAELVADVKSVPYPWLNLLLVDDEGEVSDVSEFAKKEDGGLRLRVPVHLRGDSRSKNQILIVVSSPSELSLLTIKGRRKLDALLPLIVGEKKLLNQRTEVAIASFRVF